MWAEVDGGGSGVYGFTLQRTSLSPPPPPQGTQEPVQKHAHLERAPLPLGHPGARPHPVGQAAGVGVPGRQQRHHRVQRRHRRRHRGRGGGVVAAVHQRRHQVRVVRVGAVPPQLARLDGLVVAGAVGRRDDHLQAAAAGLEVGEEVAEGPPAAVVDDGQPLPVGQQLGGRAGGLGVGGVVAVLGSTEDSVSRECQKKTTTASAAAAAASSAQRQAKRFGAKRPQPPAA